MSLAAIDVDTYDWVTFRDYVTVNKIPLLQKLGEFPNAILISGCQRSGTTILSEIINRSPEIISFHTGDDSELEGALILAGITQHQSMGRHCFQTTYLDERVAEYFRDDLDYRLIWMLRNPFSTIYSLLNNWPARALDSTFSRGPMQDLSYFGMLRCQLFGDKHISRLKKACLVYNWKLNHLKLLLSRLPPHQLLVVEYDTLVSARNETLNRISRFLELAFTPNSAKQLSPRSLNKQNQLSEAERTMIETECLPHYNRMRAQLAAADRHILQ